ncbi:MAG: hypothetical protein AAGC86_03210 [Pseudomonadota bacterium]
MAQPQHIASGAASAIPSSAWALGRAGTGPDSQYFTSLATVREPGC